MDTAALPPDRLFTELYRELKVLAGRQVRDFQGNVSLSATALLHEAYLRFSEHSPAFEDKGHFLGYAARAMRGIIIDYSRNRRAQKRGGEFHFTGITNADVAAPAGDEPDLARLGEALEELATLDPRLAEVVDLHFFCGFTFAEIAAQRGASERTVLRDWKKARLLLGDAMGRDGVS
ncbi:MAG: sigma-70 family RNA polymerase sigma factor [Gemmatimonadetes bacterium]|nr:sigma-70 family RNA polymerase sigma factor [Gemmatimonadota bacterium]